MSNLSRFLEQAEARLNGTGWSDVDKENMLDLCKAFAAVVEEAREAEKAMRDTDYFMDKEYLASTGERDVQATLAANLAAADAAVAALAGEGKDNG